MPCRTVERGRERTPTPQSHTPFLVKKRTKKKNTYQNPKVYYERISISTHSLKSAFLIEIKQSIDNMARWWSSHD